MNYNRFKERTPEKTISIAKKILDKFNLKCEETSFHNMFNNVYSCCIEIPSLNVHSNGKGTTKEYCYASAYGELIERLFNCYFRYFYLTEEHPIKLFYDSVDFSIKNQLLSLPQDIIEDMKTSFFESDKKYPSKDELIDVYTTEFGSDIIQSIPFYDVKNKNTVYLPECIISSLACSTGLSCGNSLEETLSQAIFEILERYVYSKIITTGITPPKIPCSYIKENAPELINIIDQFTSNGYIVSVYDCSLNDKFPVLAVLLINKETNSYKINFGSHFSFKIALERCLTELLQGYHNIDSIEHFGMCELSSETNNKLNTFHTYWERFTCNIGPLPYVFFKTIPSYQFKEWVYDCENWTNSLILQKLISFCLKHSSTVYIRNNSLMDLSIVRVYIPGLSHIKYIDPKGNLTKYTTRQKYCLKSYDFDNIKIKQEELNDFKRIFQCNLGKINRSINIDNDIMKAAVIYDLGDIDMTFDILKKMNDKPSFIKVIIQAIDFINYNIDKDEIYDLLQQFYNKEDIELGLFLLRGNFLEKLITVVKRNNSHSKEYYQNIEYNSLYFIDSLCSYMKEHPIDQNNIYIEELS